MIITISRGVQRVALAVVLLLLARYVGYPIYQDQRLKHATRTLLAWTRMNPPPPEAAKHFDMHIVGGFFFGREYWATFKGSPELLKNWIDGSPGTKDLKADHEANGLHYNIPPGPGAGDADLYFDWGAGSVELRAVRSGSKSPS